MKAIASFSFDGQCYKCLFSSPTPQWAAPFVVSNPRHKRILIVADFKYLPRAGRYCKRPHKMLTRQLNTVEE